MGVFFIGDYAGGKTALGLELINPISQYIRVINLDYEKMKEILLYVVTGEYFPTKINPKYRSHERALKMEVNLPSGVRNFYTDWIDTSGCIWERMSDFEQENSNIWHKLLNQVKQSECIILVLNPYQEMLKPYVDLKNPDFLPTLQQWCERFYRYVDFLNLHCTQVPHILICLHNADLFCDIEEEAFELAYNPFNPRKNWRQRNAYVTQKYFQPIQEQINEIDRETARLPVRCFITSIYNRTLLELPWIYLAHYLAFPNP